MNQKLVNDFSKKLKALDNHLGFKVLENTEANLNGSFISLSEKGNVLITYGNDTVFELTTVDETPAIDLDSIYVDKDNSALFGDLIKLCGQYLEAFFDGDQHEH
jgi:hypothetical protein|nr:MAG TPA: hypothetical protein [Caudoviricetes sp.]